MKPLCKAMTIAPRSVTREGAISTARQTADNPTDVETYRGTNAAASRYFLADGNGLGTSVKS